MCFILVHGNNNSSTRYYRFSQSRKFGFGANMDQNALRLTSLIVCILIIMTFMDITSATDIGPIKNARCRAHCMQKTIRAPYNDAACKDAENSCSRCWDMCHYLVLRPTISSSICNKTDRCQRGCKAACSFKQNAQNSGPAIDVKWAFPLEPVVEKFQKTQKVQIMWSKPTSDVQVKKRTAFVYILLVRETLGKSISLEWTEVIQTASLGVLLKLENLPHSPDFWLIAVTENGKAADVYFNMKSSFVKDVVNPPSASVSGHHGVGASEDSPIPINYTIIHNPSEKTISVRFQWENPPTPIEKGDSYGIQWFFEHCEVWEGSPSCNMPASFHQHTIFYKGEKKLSYTMENVLFNSLYKFKVFLTSKPNIWKGEVDFNTNFCELVDEQTYTKCYDQVSTTQKIVATTEIDPVQWHVNISSIKYDPDKKMVYVILSWTLPFGPDVVKDYQVRVQTGTYHEGTPSDNYSPKFIKTKETNIGLYVRPHEVFEVSVAAAFKKFDKDDKELQSSQSEILVFNTSWVNSMQKIPQPSSVTSSKVHSYINNIDGIIVGITCVASIALLGLIIYKKRHSFKDIIITKTTVAKSNSYKSNVGCKVDYSNQLSVMSDEWELEPHLLKFSSPIGQGAFGKVVTGYYENQRVAIKLVRDCAPLSYKEDLLAEINLMKRIGSHPNIVSMSGACTLSEPIALVMEYVPYGNLQNFLKKCRQEGDFQKRIGRPSEVLYSLMDENGSIDSGVITPADMLSFARQVAMAMEYLAAKKYVHRDLAARNILLGYDKVVKVCDFGLSRDIFNDNQYHKITSGKLPLKWMAIESLRDRIFTTQSDVWSFGILMWEIITMGGSPYPNIALADLYYVLANGYRMEKPSNCSEELYIIMRQCWIENPAERPNFTEIRVQIEQLLSRDRNYLELDNIDAPLSTSESSSSPKSDDSDTMSLLSTRPSALRTVPGQHRSKSNVPGTSGLSQQKTVTIATDPVTVVSIENSDEWLMPGQEEETTT